MTEAAKLQKKTINKSKLKKSIRNVICRPDPVFWPAVSTEDSSKLEVMLNKFKINLPKYKKPHWNEIKAIPKENRPKPPKLPKVEGLLFGISECLNAVQTFQCSAFIIEATVNPRTIVQPILEKCYSTKIPVLCMDNLRKICANNFGIPTSILGIKKESLHDFHAEILTITKSLKYPEVLNNEIDIKEMEIDSDIKVNKSDANTVTQSKTSELPYLYRTNKKTRIFTPSKGSIGKREFAGHDFIKLPRKEDHKPKNKMHMKMILKRILNNPNREKRK